MQLIIFTLQLLQTEMRTFEDFSKLSRSELLSEDQLGPVDLPLVPHVPRQVPHLRLGLLARLAQTTAESVGLSLRIKKKIIC